MRTFFKYLWPLICFPASIFAISVFYPVKGGEMKESTVKAMFIYNFTKYLEWDKESAEEKFVIGVYRYSDMADELMLNCNQKKVNDKPIEIVTLSNYQAISKCKIIFVPAKYINDFTQIKNIAEKNNVVVITESEGMCKKGSCINIIRQEKNLRFEINIKELTDAGVKIYEQLKKLATTVY
ncbi:MAG: YfiR family protein [Bacteroidetes bacterium]|nr:YfiR family protein [Bacteroidota bacterium]HNR19924.1 YfiR family protein [Bacteroidia bacterium]HNU32719.1 YfiR family protein [Bacteroidia bacterium]